MLQKSESIAALTAAVAKAQGEIQGAKKDSENPFFKSRYADLAAVWDACRASLTKNGIAVIQTPRTEITENATIIRVGTLMAHASGEWIYEELSAIPVKDDPQGIGSCVTYLRRYALSAFTGVAPEDDDGNAASHRNGDTKPKGKAAPKTPASPEKAEWFATIKAAGNTLNGMGDSPEWTLSRANEFANENFNTTGGVDSLTVPQLAEMARLMSNRIDELKAARKARPKSVTSDDRAEAERQTKLAKVLKSPAKAIEQAMKEHYPDKQVEQLTLDQLIHLEDEIIPF